MSINLYVRRKIAFSLFEINTLEAADNQLQEISRELGLSLTCKR